MFLHTLLRQFRPDLPLNGLKDIEIQGIREDSRLVRPGDLFIARSGTKTDGRQFVADAAAKGALAVITPVRISNCPIPQILIEDAADAVSRLANLFYEEPCRKVRVLGVTGTNGKTTTTYLIRHILSSLQRRCGMVGTVELDDGRTRRPATMTTPGAVDMAQLLATMRDRGCWSCAMEVSSHALDQGRVAGVRFAGAAFTNLTGDHLDYHKTMDNYAAAKARLFDGLDDGAVAVINANDPWSERIVRDCRARVIQFGIGRKGDYRASDVSSTAEGSRFILDTPDGDAPVEMQLIGRHNVANALTAAALAGEVFGLSVHQIADALRTAPSAPGRLQPIRCGQNFGVYVDYAHTDDGLENVLKAAAPLATGKLRVLFGCGGDRDRNKRPRMAKVAERLADVVYVTSDNPRTENPAAIIDEIISGFSADVVLNGAERPAAKPRRSSSGRCNLVIVEPDRRRAIERVLSEAGEGDIVVLAGKGHENYQIIGTEKHHFDDVEEATRILQHKTAVAGQ